MAAADADRESEARALVAARADVSRETFARFEAYLALLSRWTAKINLVGRHEMTRLWSRHLLDSLALAELLPSSGRWTDLGSGGGFPVIPLAVLSLGKGDDVAFRAVEADQRKAAFLRDAAHRLGLDGRIQILAQRIEDVAPAEETIVSARALAPLADLLGLASAWSGGRTRLALLKGEGLHGELTVAARDWHMRYQSRRISTTPSGYMLIIEGYRRVSTTGPGSP